MPVGAVCTGTYVLAKAGLLDGHRCTVHWENQDSLREQFPEIDVTEELFEIDRTRFTCAGGTAAIDMMLALIARQLGQEVASGVTDQLIHHRMRDGDERQRMELRSRLGVAHPKLISVVAEMERCIEQPLSCVDLADGAGLSTRQLERLFRKYIGQVPTRYYLGLRLDPRPPAPAADLHADPVDRARLRLRVGIAFLEMLFRALRPHPVAGAPHAAVKRASAPRQTGAPESAHAAGGIGERPSALATPSRRGPEPCPQTSTTSSSARAPPAASWRTA